MQVSVRDNNVDQALLSAQEKAAAQGVFREMKLNNIRKAVRKSAEGKPFAGRKLARRAQREGLCRSTLLFCEIPLASRWGFVAPLPEHFRSAAFLERPLRLLSNAKTEDAGRWPGCRCSTLRAGTWQRCCWPPTELLNRFIDVVEVPRLLIRCFRNVLLPDPVMSSMAPTIPPRTPPPTSSTDGPDPRCGGSTLKCSARPLSRATTAPGPLRPDENPACAAQLDPRSGRASSSETRCHR